MDDHLGKPFLLADMVLILSKFEKKLDTCENHENIERQELLDKTSENRPQSLSKTQEQSFSDPTESQPQAVITSSGIRTTRLNEKALGQILELEKNGSIGLLSKVIGIFIKDTKAALRNLVTTLKDNDIDRYVLISHSLKSAGANVGATHFAAICQKMETEGRAGNLQHSDKNLAELASEYESVITALNEFQDSIEKPKPNEHE
jgi:HPt (histidine-containing phosphotransfer) domain-containing protein